MTTRHTDPPTTPNPNRRRHALAPVGRAARLVVSLSPEDRAALEEMAERWSGMDPRRPPYSLAQVVRTLVREAALESRCL